MTMSDKLELDFNRGVEATLDDEAASIIMRLEAHYNNIIDQLDSILAVKDARIQLGEIELEPGTDKHRGFRTGIIVAKSLIGKFPVTFKDGN